MLKSNFIHQQLRQELPRLRLFQHPGLWSGKDKNLGRFALLGFLPVVFLVAHRSNLPLLPTPGTARHVSCCVRGGRGRATRWANIKILITGVLIFSSFLIGGVMAEEVCATEQCEKAQKIPSLPSDVKSFVDQRDGCDYFRGEPWAGGDEPEIKERREFIFQNIKDLCTGTDKRLEELRNKYRHDQVIDALLKGYEDRIEFK